jgi:predicted DNA-binding transcriptional regulator
MNANERRAKETELMFAEAMTSRQIAEAFAISIDLAMADIRVFLKRGILKREGIDGRLTRYRVTKVLSLSEMVERKPSEKKVAAQLQQQDIPDHLRLMFGYTDHEPKGGKFVDNSEFMPTPVRVSRVKVYPGTSWGMMEMAL